MVTDEEKAKLAKLLQEIDIPEVKLTERCSDLVKDFHQKFGEEVESEVQADATADEVYENPYRVDRRLIEDIDKKLQELVIQGKRAKKELPECIVLTGFDPKRPWRTNSTKERLLRIESEIKQHRDRAGEMMAPLADGHMKELVKECQEETRYARPVPADRLRETVDAAKKNLPNFQYRKIENSTATAILPKAHEAEKSAVPNAETTVKLV